MAPIKRISLGLILAALAVVVLLAAVNDQPSMGPVPSPPSPPDQPWTPALSTWPGNAATAATCRARRSWATPPIGTCRGLAVRPWTRAPIASNAPRYSATAHCRKCRATPYDISAGLAQRLLSWERSISLNSGQAAIYKRAMGMTHEHGLCWCACWRWHAFAGLSKALIADRRWSAAQVAQLIDALDGCGGASGNRDNNGIGMGMPS